MSNLNHFQREIVNFFLQKRGAEKRVLSIVKIFSYRCAIENKLNIQNLQSIICYQYNELFYYIVDRKNGNNHYYKLKNILLKK